MPYLWSFGKASMTVALIFYAVFAVGIVACRIGVLISGGGSGS